MIAQAPLVAALERKGFTSLARRSDAVRMVRKDDDRHDHVLLGLAPVTWWRRLSRRPRRVVDIVAGVVWPIGEQAFSRAVPAEPPIPQQAHAATGFGSLCRGDVDVATVAAAVDDWCRRLEDPVVALEVGAITDATRRLEFAVVTARREVGLAAADRARRDVQELAPALRAKASKRIDLAEQRLPRD